MISAAIEIPEAKIADFCQRHHITKMALFGSVLRDDFGPDSDVDVIVEFDPKHNPGWYFFDIQDDLGEILGRKVDMHTPAELKRYLKHVFQEARTIYDAA